jgi:hypothetical protein
MHAIIHPKPNTKVDLEGQDAFSNTATGVDPFQRLRQRILIH